MNVCVPEAGTVPLAVVEGSDSPALSTEVISTMYVAPLTSVPEVKDVVVIGEVLTFVNPAVA